MSTTDDAAVPEPAQAAFEPQAGIGVPIGVFGFGFSVLVLGFADARVFTPNAIGFFAPVAFSFGALMLLLGIASTMAVGDTTTFLTKAGGWVLIIDGIVAWYLAWALTVNGLIGDRLPLWPYPYFKEEARPEVPAGIAPTAVG